MKKVFNFFLKNNLYLGVFIGLILPGSAAFLSYWMNWRYIILGKEDLIYIICVALNLIIIRIYLNRQAFQTGRGIVFSTFVLAFIFIIYKYWI